MIIMRENLRVFLSTIICPAEEKNMEMSSFLIVFGRPLTNTQSLQSVGMKSLIDFDPPFNKMSFE